MKIERFNEIVEYELSHARSTLVKKQAEYNLTEDRLDSFKHGAAITSWNPDQVLLGYLTKHIASIIEMINSDKQFTEEKVDEKIGDAINYLVLLRGVWEDMGKIEGRKK